MSLIQSVAVSRCDRTSVQCCLKRAGLWLIINLIYSVNDFHYLMSFAPLELILFKYPKRKNLSCICKSHEKKWFKREQYSDLTESTTNNTLIYWESYRHRCFISEQISVSEWIGWELFNDLLIRDRPSLQIYQFLFCICKKWHKLWSSQYSVGEKDQVKLLLLLKLW